MNATYNIDHLQAVTHVTSLLNSTTASGTPTISKPKTAATSHYDSTGTQVATMSNTSYEDVTFAADGSISGGNLSHESSTPDGTKLSTTSVGFQNDGKPVSAQINVNNINGSGDFKNVQMDMSGVTWNNSFAISSGQVKMTTLDASTQQKKNDGVIQFNNESVVSGSITHYDPDNAGAVSGYSEVDYSQAKLLGSSILGGQYSVKHMTPDKVLSASSTVSLSSEGRLQAIETSNVDPATSAVTSKVSVDFSQIVFDTRNEFLSGSLGFTVNDNAGNLMSKTSVTFANSLPTNSTTSVYVKDQLQNKIVVDYSDSLFNNDHQVVDSTKTVNIYSNTDKLLFSTVISYDKNGKKTKDKNPKDKKGAPLAVKASAPAPAKAVKSAVKKSSTTTTVKTAPKLTSTAQLGDTPTTQKTDKTYRTDNTLEQMRVTTLQGNTPISAVITNYAADGTTVVKTFTLDLSGLNYDQASNTVTGALNLQTHLGGNVLSSQSTIQY